MKQNYNNCLARLLKDEGGYTNNPNDSGGPTNYGITLADYRKYINSKGTANDVRNMTVNQAKAIYKPKYWDALGCDDLSSGVDYTVFDYGVNSGLGRPKKALQKFKSLQGTKLIDAINDERMSFLRSIGGGHNAGFMAGWTARVSRVRAYSKQLAMNTSAGPAIGVTATGFGLWASQYWHQHEVLIIITAAVAAIAIGYAIHKYINKGK